MVIIFAEIIFSQDKTIVSCRKEDIKDSLVDEDLVCLMTFEEFNKNSAKNRPLKVKDMFVKQLLQIYGVSVEKALAIVDKYPTPSMLKMAYQEAGPGKGDKLLANIKFGAAQKNIGQNISKIIYNLFCNESYPC